MKNMCMTPNQKEWARVLSEHVCLKAPDIFPLPSDAVELLMRLAAAVYKLHGGDRRDFIDAAGAVYDEPGMRIAEVSSSISFGGRAPSGEQ